MQNHFQRLSKADLYHVAERPPSRGAQSDVIGQQHAPSIAIGLRVRRQVQVVNIAGRQEAGLLHLSTAQSLSTNKLFHALIEGCSRWAPIPPLVKLRFFQVEQT